MNEQPEFGLVRQMGENYGRVDQHDPLILYAIRQVGDTITGAYGPLTEEEIERWRNHYLTWRQGWLASLPYGSPDWLLAHEAEFVNFE